VAQNFPSQGQTPQKAMTIVGFHEPLSSEAFFEETDKLHIAGCFGFKGDLSVFLLGCSSGFRRRNREWKRGGEGG